jgi:hypothetical protein
MLKTKPKNEHAFQKPIGEEDEMADFIVDEEELDENGIPLRYLKCTLYSLSLRILLFDLMFCYCKSMQD